MPLDAGHMDPAVARQLFFGLRLASGNLRFLEEEALWMDLAEADLDREADARAGRDMPLSPISSIKYVEVLRIQVFISKT